MHNILYLTPVDSIPFQLEQIQQLLQQMAVINAPPQNHTANYALFSPGENIMQHVIFLGCSPVLAITGLTGNEECVVELENHETEQFIGGSNVKPLRCSHCKTSNNNWHSFIEAWRNNPNENDSWQCEQCRSNHSLKKASWRKCAGFGRSFIKIWGIFESEAVPSDQLLHALQNATRSKWKYFYYRDE